jgi:hypothetical protein
MNGVIADIAGLNHKIGSQRPLKADVPAVRIGVLRRRIVEADRLPQERCEPQRGAGGLENAPGEGIAQRRRRGKESVERRDQRCCLAEPQSVDARRAQTEEEHSETAANHGLAAHHCRSPGESEAWTEVVRLRAVDLRPVRRREEQPSRCSKLSRRYLGNRIQRVRRGRPLTDRVRRVKIEAIYRAVETFRCAEIALVPYP